ncbi:MAG: MBL fold metallo-hydrolase [Candidatus Geothermincolia bacterium]
MAEFRGYSVGEGTWLIDSFMAGTEGFMAVYAVKGSDGTALVDTGVSDSAESVLAGLRLLELDTADIRYIVLTHLHLDHVGGAGYLLPHMPNATVVVDETAMGHLAAPERLLAGARKSLGKFAAIYGDLTPIPEERMLPAAEGLELDLGERSLTLKRSPGHARTHYCAVESREGCLFPGDAMGVFLPEGPWVCPTTPPPDFDLAVMTATLERLRDLDAPTTYFPHFGPGGASGPLAIAALELLGEMVDTVKHGLAQGRERGEILERLTSLRNVTDDRSRMHFMANLQLCLSGLARYLGG